MLKVIILGSGACVPNKRRGSPGIVVNSNEQNFLIDSSSGTLYRMAKAGLDFKSIDCLLYTHSHPDHTIDIVPFLFALNYTPGYKREEMLEIVGPDGFVHFYNKLKLIYPWIEPRDYSINISEVANSAFAIDDIFIQSVLVEHGGLPSVAYRLTNGEESMVFSGDTAFCDGLVQLSKHTDLLILESSFPSAEHKVGDHLTASEAGKIADMADVKNLVLTHFYPICDNYDMQSICAKEFKGNIIISEDFVEIEVSEGIVTSRIADSS